MRLLWLPLLFVACGGGDSDETATDDAGTGDPVDPCAGIVPYDIVGMECTQLASAYENTLASADVCTADTDCNLVRAPCEQWHDVTCWYVANDCITASDLAEYTTESQGCAPGDPRSTCTCTGAEPTVACLAGRCELVVE